MTEDDVKKIATRFVAEQSARHSREHGVKPFAYSCQGARMHPRLKGEWSVIFEVRTAEGHLIDGPAIVLVDDATGDVKFFD